MFSLTKQERIVLLILLCVITFGHGLSFLFKKFPEVKSLSDIINSPNLYRKVNINKATEAELIAVPYIGPYTAKQIIEKREQEGPFKDIETLKNIPGIKEKNYQKFKNYVAVK